MTCVYTVVSQRGEYEQRLQNPAQKFQSIEDVIINVSGIKETTMQKMIDA